MVAIKSSIFSSNEADVGGGISVDLVHDAHRCPSNGNTLLIENCMFDNNTVLHFKDRLLICPKVVCIPNLY